MTAPDFQLTPKSNEVNSKFAAEVLATIKFEENTRHKKRPVLVADTYRIPIGLKRQLRSASKTHGISQTSIVVEALRRLLPALLSKDELDSAAARTDADE